MSGKSRTLLCASLLFMAACNPDLDAVNPPCGPNGECPPGMTCSGDDRCLPTPTDGNVPLDVERPDGNTGADGDTGAGGPVVLLEPTFSVSGPHTDNPQVKLLDTSFIMQATQCSATDNLCLIGGIRP